MTAIELYLDPVCPFGWVSAQWLLGAGSGTDSQITLRQMSLAVLNEGHDVDAGHRPMIDRSRRVGRLFAAVADRHGAEGFTALYQEFGVSTHVRGNPMTGEALTTTLAALGMDPALAKAAEDSGLDPMVARAHLASQQALGGRGGCPIVAVDGRGFVGPVLTEIPAAEGGADLLGALITMASTPGFAALQRPYSGPPATGEHTPTP
ncbi:mycothiol-dependent nitroreductase Rv2466c family protein [Nocardia australiensis]|uniref:mycothiol-dependent nitroreductase Rv2466c family protein n=1 Tax=Nocardia australiensis TaxID=2887191 RepID=UPI001D14E6AA|nr:disulfide bond formation protein DsbA [Nocardia australiensis]